jgi:hypothetical protein
MKVCIFKKFIKLHVIVVRRLLVHISVPYKVKVLGKTFHKIFFTPGRPCAVTVVESFIYPVIIKLLIFKLGFTGVSKWCCPGKGFEKFMAELMKRY